MAKFDVRRLSAAEKRRLLVLLEQTILRLRDANAIREFLEGILTSSERVMLARRCLVAQRLLTGRTYVEIRRELGVGLSTVEFVDAWLRKSQRGYRYADPVKRWRRRRRLMTREIRRAMAEEARLRPSRMRYSLSRVLTGEAFLV